MDLWKTTGIILAAIDFGLFAYYRWFRKDTAEATYWLAWCGVMSAGAYAP